MSALISLHQLAARRGDGLLPELLEVLTRRQQVESATGNVADIAQHRDDALTQAGPNPVGRLADANLENVVRLERPAKDAPLRRPVRSRRR